MSTLVAAVLMIGVVAYAVFGGADFGAGFWDLVAGGTKRGDKPRAVIDHSIGPVWEANHVWLIFCFVVLWTGFPEAYESITSTLFVPLTIAAFGIVLRGASFAFRHSVYTTRDRRTFGAIFAVSSVLVPYAFGAIIGAIASGEVPKGGLANDPVTAWFTPTSIFAGFLAVAMVAFLAAVYLVKDAQHLGDAEMVEYFRRRALGSGVVAGLVAAAGLLVVRSDAPFLYDGLTSRAAPIVALSAIAGIGAIVLLAQRRHTLARVAAALAVASLISAWGIGQWDYILPETLTVAEAAAPSGTLEALIVVVGLAVVIVAPSLTLLYTLTQRGFEPLEELSEDAPSGA